MSTKLLGKVTQGSLRAEQNCVVDLSGDMVATCNTAFRAPGEGSANAQLFALAYDHALWGAAVATGRVKWQPKMQSVALLSIKPPQPSDVSDEDYADAGGREWRPQILHAFPTTLDAFGCPALTPKLRAELRAMLWLK